MVKSNYREFLIKSLKDPEEAQGYLEAALADGDSKVFLAALRDVAEAQGGMTAIARKTKLHRTGLYRFFSRQGNPTYENLMVVVKALGYRLRLDRNPAKARRRVSHAKAA
jgi:probable addiction module antidote protein